MLPSKIDTYTPIWKKRNNWIKNFIPVNSSILDIGCGNKSILDYVVCNNYLGLDLTEYADIKTDLNTEKVEINQVFDIGLIIGVLEYLDDPNDVISKYKNNAKKWIIVTKKNVTERTMRKYGWKQKFKLPTLEEIYNQNFTNVEIVKNHKDYYLGLCSTI